MHEPTEELNQKLKVDYDGDANYNSMLIEHESGIRIEVKADDKEQFQMLYEEIFGDPETLAGAVYRTVMEMQTDSGMTAEEVIEAARDRAADQN